jgi:uncharacterized protein
MNKEQLKSQLKEAMKAKDAARLSVIRTLLSAIQYEEMESSTDGLAETAVVALVKREIKKRQEELEFAEKADRAEQIASLHAEVAILEGFLPRQLSEQQIEKILEPLVDQAGENGMGVLMKHLKDNHAGQYDGKLASSVVKRLLN